MKKILCLLVLVLLPFAALGNGAPVNTGKNNLALDGYDPAYYFTHGQAAKGKGAISAHYNGIIYYFVDAQSRDAFIKKLDAYLPQYGGYCAGGMAEGQRNDADPKIWKLEGGKLYLFQTQSAYKQFAQDPRKSIAAADKAWAKLTQGE